MKRKSNRITKHQRIHISQMILHHRVWLPHFIDPFQDLLPLCVLRFAQHFTRLLAIISICFQLFRLERSTTGQVCLFKEGCATCHFQDLFGLLFVFYCT